ncbi:MAG: CCA tRNA nucleotidyltransferase [Candidatus Cyclobacteriaceae bacterium M2_1C_046]
MNLASELQDNLFKTIGKAADKLNFEAYVVGGYVRDILLKRPSKDIDFVCVGSGIEWAQQVAKDLGKAKVNIFKSFGTAQVKHKDWELEFVGARKESYRAESRKPVVEDGTLEDDQKRRDFTINALAINLNKDNFGELIDPFDGIKDLNSRLIKTPLEPGSTFSDDPLRMMRAVRFAAQLNFDIEADTFTGIIEHSERIRIISQERITDELNKIILSETPSYGFKLLYHAKLLDIIFPELVELQGAETKDGKGHKDNFYHTLQVLDNVAERSDDLWLRWAAILHDIAKPATKRFDKKAGWTFHGHEDKGARMVPGIFKKLKLPMGEPMKKVQKLVKLHLRPIALVKDTVTDTAIRRLLYEAGDDVDDLMNLCKADVTSKNHAKVKRYISNFKKVEEKMKEVEEKDKIRNFQPPVDGEEIMRVFNIGPGKIIGELKEEIKEAILEGKISNNYQEAYLYMLDIAKKKGLEKPNNNNS